jgi:hypothetical protein
MCDEFGLRKFCLTERLATGCGIGQLKVPVLAGPLPVVSVVHRDRAAVLEHLPESLRPYALLKNSKSASRHDVDALQRPRPLTAIGIGIGIGNKFDNETIAEVEQLAVATAQIRPPYSSLIRATA